MAIKLAELVARVDAQTAPFQRKMRAVDAKAAKTNQAMKRLGVVITETMVQQKAMDMFRLTSIKNIT